jgi:hypothetical protein
MCYCRAAKESLGLWWSAPEQAFGLLLVFILDKISTAQFSCFFCKQSCLADANLSYTSYKLQSVLCCLEPW